MYGWGDYSDCYVYLANGTKILHEYKDRQQDECRNGSLVYEANDECCASFGGGRIVNTNNGANSKVHYFLTDHYSCKCVVAKEMPDRIDLDRKDYYLLGKTWKQPLHFSGERTVVPLTRYADLGVRFYNQ